jgi:hypothetical protein
VAFPDLAVNVTPGTMQMVRLGPDQPFGDQAIRQIAQAAETSGYAITAATIVHGTVLAVKKGPCIWSVCGSAQLVRSAAGALGIEISRDSSGTV